MKLEYFFLLALIFEAIHAWEEYYFAFKHRNTGDNFTGGINLLNTFKPFSKDQSNLIVYKVMMIVMILFITLIIAGGVFKIAALSLLGIYFTYQLHHIWDSILSQRYNPGLVTSLLWLPVVILWWKYFIVNFL